MTAEPEAEDDEPAAHRLPSDGERRFEEWLSIGADWFWETDAEGRFTWVSRDTALPAGAVLGRRRQELTEADTEADPAWRAHVADLSAGRPFRNFRYSSRLPGGALRHVSVSGDPVRGPDGKIAGWRDVGRDVTTEVDATLRLEESRRRLSAQVALLGRLAAEDPLPTRGLEAALSAVVHAASDAFEARYASVCRSPTRSAATGWNACIPKTAQTCGRRSRARGAAANGRRWPGAWRAATAAGAASSSASSIAPPIRRSAA